MAAVPNVKIVKFIRLNTIKAAISSYRGRVTHKACGTSNKKSSYSGMKDDNNSLIRVPEKWIGKGTETNGQRRERYENGRKLKECNIPESVKWTVKEFVAEVSIWQVHIL